MVDLTKKDTPSYCELDWIKAEKALQISVHPQVLEDIYQVFNQVNHPLVTRYQEYLDLPRFIPPDHGSWGYGEHFVPEDAVLKGWSAWRCVLPEGGAMKTIPDWSQLFAISAQLNILFRILEYKEGAADSKRLQLMAPVLTTNRDNDGGAIGVKLSPQMARFLSTMPNQSRDLEIEQEMKSVYSYLNGQSLFAAEEKHFTVDYRHPFRVDLECPGDRAGLNPQSWSFENNQGYELQSHNIDTPLQQLTLIVGLAKLHQKARLAGF